MYSKELIEKIKEANDIVSVIQDYQTLHRHGKQWLGICPFHADSTPSLTVTASMQIYKCFACGASGDVIKYVEHAEGCSFTEALQILARRVHIELPQETEETEEEREARKQREELFLRQEQLQRSFTQDIDQNPYYQMYLEERQISLEAAREFGLGYAAEGEFIGRITYPIYTVSGKIAGFTGRILDGFQVSYPFGNDLLRCAGSKYKNSAESAVFHKDELLFGLRQARQEIQKQDLVYIVEGQNDVLRMWMTGHKNTVAGSGTAFSEKQAHLLQRFTQNVTLMYDGDNAGRKATLRTMRLLLGLGFRVSVLPLPEGEDPDTWLLSRDISPNVSTNLQTAAVSWNVYLGTVYPYVADSPEETQANAQEMSKMIAVVPSRMIRRHLTGLSAAFYHTDTDQIRQLVNEEKVADRQWESGLYGIEEAKQSGKKAVTLTFDRDRYISNLDEDESWLLWQGEAQPAYVQQLRQFTEILVDERETSESEEILLSIQQDGQRLQVLQRDNRLMSFTDWYLRRYSDELQLSDEDGGPSSTDRTNIIRRCISVIASTDATEREVNSQQYRQWLNLPAQNYNTLLKEQLQQRKDRREAERKRIAAEEKTRGIDLYDVPDYVQQDEVLMKQYNQYGFYPLLVSGSRIQDSYPSGNDLLRCAGDGSPKYVAYVFKNEKGGGHTIVSDFYMEALLFVDPATDHSKRVIRLNHLHGGEQYVEWPSDAFVSITDMKKRLFSSGAYNFNGSPIQWDRVRQQLSYNFINCYEARVFGWQPEGFLMLPNAVYYPDEESWKLEYMNTLGVAEVETARSGKMRFYSPAASSIRLGGRQEDNPYEQDELAYYLEPTGKNRMEFTEWAQLMSEVFQVNDNGKWAVMFTIACNFRDLIYKIVGSFTALCFAGPTGSGKSELAYAIRGLWQRRRAAVFNLNSGSDAAFFLTLEHFRNMPVIMEEYNDNSISAIKFQGLKAAVYDDKGRTKVKDIASKSLDTSKTNAAPILLGQDTPQQDDGSLSNRVIICEVPKKEGGFTREETAKFERLKQQAEYGMGNILLDIVRQRPVFERYFKQIFNEEVVRMKDATWDGTTNKEGLERVIRSVAILSATARLLEERCDIRLPWHYADFYHLAVNKIPRQMESISKTSKIGNFFQALNVALTNGRLLQGRELKVERAWERKIRVKDGIGSREVEVGEGSKLLYLHFDSCYSVYCKEVSKDVLSKQTLTNYFRSHSAFIGLVKSTRFTWQEAQYGEGVLLNRGTGEAADSTVETTARMQMQTKSFVSSAYVFNYDVLRETHDIDFTRDTLNAASQPAYADLMQKALF